MMGFPIIVDVHGLLKMDTFGKGMKSFPILSLLVTVTVTPLDLLPYIRISNSISLSHTLPLVLHFMLVLDSSLFVFYHVSSRVSHPLLSVSWDLSPIHVYKHRVPTIHVHTCTRVHRFSSRPNPRHCVILRTGRPIHLNITMIVYLTVE